jgi:hypothetical protein
VVQVVVVAVAFLLAERPVALLQKLLDLETLAEVLEVHLVGRRVQVVEVVQVV